MRLISYSIANPAGNKIRGAPALVARARLRISLFNLRSSFRSGLHGHGHQKGRQIGNYGLKSVRPGRYVSARKHPTAAARPRFSRGRGSVA